MYFGFGIHVLVDWKDYARCGKTLRRSFVSRKKSLNFLRLGGTVFWKKKKLCPLSPRLTSLLKILAVPLVK